MNARRVGLIALFALSGAGVGALGAALSGTRPLWWIVPALVLGGLLGMFWAGAMHL